MSEYIKRADAKAAIYKLVESAQKDLLLRGMDTGMEDHAYRTALGKSMAALDALPAAGEAVKHDRSGTADAP